MRFVADLHIHSKYSRACSQYLIPENIDKWCKLKGINLIGTGDFTHPGWMTELKSKLRLTENGFYVLNNTSEQSPTYFVPTVEISCIYSRGGKTRRIHLIIVVKNLLIAEKLNDRLAQIGKLASDGRPILGLDAEELVKYICDCSEDSLIIPAHIWTPWFALFGSKSGFDSLEECFGNMSKHIYAVETGLSSNPPMNWMIKDLDNIAIMSNSDAHSLGNLGREANVFEGDELSYETFYNAITKKGKQNKLKFTSTIEFYPEEGKYHVDGHKDCKTSFTPAETKKLKGLCPVCRTSLTVGVLNRVEELAERSLGEKPETALYYKSIVPLLDIIAQAINTGKQSKKVQTIYLDLLRKFGSEFDILLNINLEELTILSEPLIIEGIRRVRNGEINIIPGYDGVYGKVEIFKEHELSKLKTASLTQTALFPLDL